MTLHLSNFVKQRPRKKQGPFIKFRLTSSHDIFTPPAPHCPQFGGDGTTIGSRTVEFNAPGIAPRVVSGSAVVELDSASGAPKWTKPEWIK